MKIATFLGIDIKIHKMLIVLIIIAAFLGYIENIMIIFIIIFIHDFIHTIVSYLLNLKVKEIELTPFGGVAKVESIFELNPVSEILIAAAGPLSNIMIIMILVVIDAYYKIPWKNLSLIIDYNLMIAGFNLLPALPLDGGRILRAILSTVLGFKKGTTIAANCGKILAVFLMIWGIYGVFYGFINFTVFIIAIFMMMTSIKEHRMASYILLRDITYKKDTLIKEGSMPIKQMVVRKSMTIRNVIEKFVPHRYHMILVIDDEWKTIGYVNETEIVNSLIEKGPNILIGNILKNHL